MWFVLYECFIYAVHRGMHAAARFRTGRRLVREHLSHHAIHFSNERYAYPLWKMSREAGRLVALRVASPFFANSPSASHLIELGTLYTAIHVLLHVPLSFCVVQRFQSFHKVHHTNPQFNHGVTSPFFDCLCGTLHPRWRITRSWKALLLPIPVLGFWGVECCAR